MKKYFLQGQAYILFSLLFISCNGQVNSNFTKDIIDQPKSISVAHSKLVKTQGSDESDNVWCVLQDKSGNLWFGTTGEGVYRYDGKGKDYSCPNTSLY
jgi:ligand-binding sensor domain-containing protein